MKAIRLEQPRQLDFVSIAEPASPGPGEVLVEWVVREQHGHLHLLVPQ